tara:strand:+ start:524 stop:670 length:147 start_codon:yes stop_codon:yes gene_type:complete
LAGKGALPTYWTPLLAARDSICQLFKRIERVRKDEKRNENKKIELGRT